MCSSDLLDENTSLRLTTNGNSQASSCYHRRKLNVTQPFTVSFRYWVTNKSGNPADGMTVIFQNSSLTSLGASGGSLGYLGITPSLGWALDIYSNPNEALVWLYAGARSTRFETLAPNGITLDSGLPVDVTLTYDLSTLDISVTQDGHTVSASSPAVNLLDYFGTPYVYFGFTGATGGQNAEQYVSDLTFTSDLPAPGGSAYGNTVVATAGSSSAIAVAVRADAREVSVGGLTLESGASVTVSAASGSVADTAYTLGIGGLAVNGPSASLNVQNNGAGAGTVRLSGTLAFAAGATLTLQGAFAADGTLQVSVPELGGGLHPLIDLTQATGLSLSDFELVTPMLGARLVLHDGVLYVLKATGTLLELK